MGTFKKLKRNELQFAVSRKEANHYAKNGSCRNNGCRCQWCVAAEINIVTHHDMGHANDLTWNGGSYFMAKGGGNTNSTDIIKYGSDLFLYGTARYLCGDHVGERLERVSSISYFKDAHFILGAGLQVAPCLFRDNVFSQIKNISIDNSQIKREEFTDRQPQGSCIFNNNYYKVFSYKTSMPRFTLHQP